MKSPNTDCETIRYHHYHHHYHLEADGCRNLSNFDSLSHYVTSHVWHVCDIIETMTLPKHTSKRENIVWEDDIHSNTRKGMKENDDTKRKEKKKNRKISIDHLQASAWFWIFSSERRSTFLRDHGSTRSVMRPPVVG